MVKNKHKKPAVVLILIIIVITSLTLIVMSSVSVVTKNHTKYTTGKNRNGAINVNNSSGRFICYRDSDNNLKQVTIKYRTDGTINKPEDMQTVDSNGNCKLEVPNSSTLYKITLIGAGGGGALPYAKAHFNKTLEAWADDSIAIGKNLIKFQEIFTTKTKYITQDQANSIIYGNFFANLKAKIKAPDAVKEGGTYGAIAGTCSFNITGGTDIDKQFLDNSSKLKNKIIYFGTQKGINYPGANSNKNEDAYIKLEDGGKEKIFKSIGGLAPLKDLAGGLFSPKICNTTHDLSELYRCKLLREDKATNDFCDNFTNSDEKNKCRVLAQNQIEPSKLYTADGAGKCFYNDGSNTTSSNSEEERGDTTSYLINKEDATFKFIVQYKGIDYEAKQNEVFKFSLKENAAEIFAGTPGEAGMTTTFETRFLVKEGNTLIITPENIGIGGMGGTPGSTIGKNGSDTKLELDTNSGRQSLIARGGKGGKNESLRLLEGYPTAGTAYNIGKDQFVHGTNGILPMKSLSGDFDIENVSAGMSAGNVTDEIKPATFPGSSGASGSLYWSAINSEAASPWIEFNPKNAQSIKLTDNETNLYNPIEDYYTTNLSAGQGASGAIIIEW